MNMVSKMALGLALALGAASMVATAPAAAKQKQASISLSGPVREKVAAAQTALGKDDVATAKAALTEAEALIKTPDDKLVVGQFYLQIAQKSNDNALLGKAVNMMLDSGKAPADNLAALQVVKGKLAYHAKDYATAVQALTAAQAANSTDPDLVPVLVSALSLTGRTPEALGTLEQAIAKQQAAGQAVPSDWYARGISMAYSAKGKDPASQAQLAASTMRITQSWLAAYPTKSNWRDSLIIYRDMNKIDADQELDVSRLMRTAGALNGERDYMDYVQATYLRFPAEAKAVLEEGKAAGTLNLTAPGNAKELYGIVSAKIAADKASLSKNAASGRAALSTGDAYLGYKDWASAIDLYKQALAKGGVDANVVNTRLGMALAMAGRKDEAKQVFSAVTGPRAGLAKYWLIYLDHPVA
jgi:lipopolysaccharide biosynthesis regulator YciM